MNPFDTALIRTRSVLTRTSKGVYARLTDSQDPHPTKVARWATLTIDPNLAKELGDPEEITVTIEPGDKLND